MIYADLQCRHRCYSFVIPTAPGQIGLVLAKEAFIIATAFKVNHLTAAMDGKVITLRFSNILDLVDFQMVTQTHRFEINTVHLTLTGYFSEADIELAREGYNATCVSYGTSL